MSFFRYVIQGIGWQVGSDIAKEARAGLEESVEEAEKREAEREREEREAAAGREKAARLAAKEAAREAARRAAQVEKDLAALKKKVKNQGR